MRQYENGDKCSLIESTLCNVKDRAMTFTPAAFSGGD